MADAMTNENLYSNLGVNLRIVCDVHYGTGNSVRHLIGMGGIYFFKHNYPFPFLARSNRSITSSWGLLPAYSPVQFSRTI